MVQGTICCVFSLKLCHVTVILFRICSICQVKIGLGYIWHDYFLFRQQILNPFLKIIYMYFVLLVFIICVRHRSVSTRNIWSQVIRELQVREENPILYSHKTQLNIKLSLLQHSLKFRKASLVRPLPHCCVAISEEKSSLYIRVYM